MTFNIDKLINAVQKACKLHVNLLGSGDKFGEASGATAPLYDKILKKNIPEFERVFYDFFFCGTSGRSVFGQYFDNFCGYLKEKGPGCKWPFPAYLSFIMYPKEYFPVSPKRYDALLGFYRTDETISRKIYWERYLLLLEIADELRDIMKKDYGDIDAIQIQSYMYVLGRILLDTPQEKKDTAKAFARKLKNEIKNAKRRTTIGWDGEDIVVKKERDKLNKAGFGELAEKVHRVSLESDSFGYDVLSFNNEGREIHIEVKTTTANENQDRGFWLSEWEREVAEKDNDWLLYRVYLSGKQTKIKPLGNIIRNPVKGWEKQVDSWRFKKTSI